MVVAKDAGAFYRLVMAVLWVLFRIFTRLHVTGVDNVPLEGPVIICPNHLHMLDIPMVGMCIRRRTVILVADKWRGTLAGRAMELATRVIYIARGEADRDALTAALKVLRAQGAMAVAPEGTRTRKPGLQEGHDGAAYLASRTGAAIVPVAVWGTEKALPAIVHLRRAETYVVICRPVVLPPEASRAKITELHQYTRQVMTVIARELPPEYRGMYGSEDRS
jgi:1-acyl-sn-glycerol-3-phosphate acyltransferase